ncbi:glycosyltransferase family 4 protein [Kiloniella laminariae]|uniref:glycosyltransferase family 4 protein n=1 Tax=Kiloniella laminariae TaxID=454162 RepID=UPI00036E728A|nr:glycosyltransferase family 4 protein [Kiloniella laminariae]
MRVAFYAPLKSPRHPTPSGDRHIARLLIKALESRGCAVEIASHLRSRDGQGNSERQQRLQQIGDKLAQRYIRKILARPAGQRPELWLTYHLYYKAADWIGPKVCKALNIPYVVVEASVANKRAGGPWDLGHRAVLSALSQAECVISLNPHDTHCLPQSVRSWNLPPFIETNQISAALVNRTVCRQDLIKKYALDPNKQWLLAIAMMRQGDKLASYQVLAKALRGLPDLSWQLLVIGDGKAREQVQAAFNWAAGQKVIFAGELTGEQLARVIPGCDIYVWPAVNEAFGLSLLEAQAGGLPVIAGNTGGVPAVVANGETGILTAPGDPVAFAAALRCLMTAPVRRRAMGQAAAEKVEGMHSLAIAGERLEAILKTCQKGYIQPGLPLFDFSQEQKSGTGNIKES